MCCRQSDGCRCISPVVAVAEATAAAAEGALEPAAAIEVTAADGPTLDDKIAWLMDRGLLSPSEGLSEGQVVRRYDALSKCAFGECVGEKS